MFPLSIDLVRVYEAVRSASLGPLHSFIAPFGASLQCRLTISFVRSSWAKLN